MGWFKRVALGIVILLVLVAAAAGWYVKKSFPLIDGELSVPGLSAPIRVERDPSDITHIKAATAQDAWFGLGYVHAQERSWQLEFNRRLMHGELSEVFGSATLETDKLLRALGIMQAAQAQWNGLPDEARVALKSYADGINAFHATSEQALPPEFHILGVKPGTWTPQDSVAWSIMMALDLGGNWGSEFARLSAAQTLSTEHMWQLLAPYGKEPPVSKVDFFKLYADLQVYKSKPQDATKTVADHADHMGATFGFESTMLAEMRQWASDFANNAGNVEGKGSNNWVIAGSHTISGKPLLANDPHLGLSAPAIWYFASLQAPGINVIGATLPGLPFVVLGRSDKVAWGITNTGPDTQDLYLEQINPANPGQYRVPDVDGVVTWAEFKARQETIKVKNQADLVLTLRETRHGPVLSDAQKSHADLLDLNKYVLSLRWNALDADNQTVLAGVRANRARNVEELKAAYAVFQSPMSNLVIADVDGHIAFKAVGKVPLRRADNDIMGLAPSPGWDARYDWAGWIATADTPEDDGHKGWVASANQKITAPDYRYFLGQDFTLPDRFDRIEELLAATPKHDLASMQKIQSDEHSSGAARLLPLLLKAKSSHPLSEQAMAKLKGFDSVMRPDTAAPLIFASWVDEVTRGLIQPKLGSELFKSLYGKRHFRFTVEEALLEPDAWWCAPKTCDEQVNSALDRALDRLQAAYGSDVSQWRWGIAHASLSAHKPFSNVGPLARYFDVRSATGGDAFTVNVGQYWPVEGKLPFASRHAASMRAMFDLSNLENSRFIYQTGQSGLVFSDRYRDMAAPWRAVEYRPMQLSPPSMLHSLTLTP
jgi:penicillin amidase